MLKTVGNPSTRYGDQTIINGNLVIGTAGNGIDFSADSHAAGMTSELLSDYEEGTWTPVISAFIAPTVTYSLQTGQYTKIGNVVYCRLYVDFDITVGGVGALEVSLPFTGANLSGANQRSLASYYDSAGVEAIEAGGVEFGVATMKLYRDNIGTSTSSSVTGRRAFYMQFFYFV